MISVFERNGDAKIEHDFCGVAASSENQARCLSSPIEKDKCQLSQLIHQKDAFTLRELETLRKEIECQQQIQMTMKNNNPYKVHIQCKHFKSKKCTFQVTFKASNVNTAVNAQSLPFISSHSSITSQSSAVVVVDTAKCSLIEQQSVLNHSSPLSYPSTTLRLSSSCAASSSVEDFKRHPDSTQFPLSGDKATVQQSQGHSCASAALVHPSGKTEINLSSPQKLFPSLPSPPPMEGLEGEGECAPLWQHPLKLEIDNESYFDMIDEQQHVSSNHYSLRSPVSISPFVFQVVSSHHDINLISLDDEKIDCEGRGDEVILKYEANNDENRQTAAEDDEENDNEDSESNEKIFRQPGGELFFKFSNCRLHHRNHPVMSDEEYKIHLAKRWLEGHSEKIEKIYQDLRERKGQNFKITPKIIKKGLLDAYDIDIYAKCTEKSHKKFLKKKLDNLMKAIRQKERTSMKSQTQQKASPKQPLSLPSISSESPIPVLIPVAEQSQASEIEIKIEEDQIPAPPQLKPQAPSLQISSHPKLCKEEWESFLQLDTPCRLQSAH